MTDMYSITGKAKKLSMALIAVGVVALGLAIAGIFGAHDEHHKHEMVTRLWSNLLIDGFYFFAISMGALFFVALQNAAEVGWWVVLKRAMEATTAFLPIGAAVMLVVFLAGSLHFHHMFHWMDSEAVAHDEILSHKQPYLNLPFFWIRFIVFMTVYLVYQRVMRKWSLAEDEVGGLTYHKKAFTWSAAFLVFFGYTILVGSWDWIMSIDAHWFSTLFGWYVFSGMWCTAMVAVTLLVLHLKKNGYLKEVNDSHIQDLGKWVFATSFLWSYLWFSQFMLIWYSNIPEEVTYFIARITDYKWIFWSSFAVNFVIPMIVLMDKNMKKNYAVLSIVGIIILFGHWVDVYMMITPGTMKEHGHFGFVEIGMFLGFAGLFIMVVLNAVSKARLVVKNGPYLEESIHFHQ